MTCLPLSLLSFLFLTQIFPSAQSHPILPTYIRAPGQTLEPCQQSLDCISPLVCLDTTFRSPCTPSTQCVCSPPNSPALQPCSTTADCPRGELCAAGLPAVSFSCVSDRVVAFDPRLREVDAQAHLALAPEQGLTLEQCRSDRQCRHSRKCLIAGLDRPESCAQESIICVCIALDGLEDCASSAKCVRGEVCTRGVLPGRDVCASKLIVDVNDRLVQVEESAMSSPGADFLEGDASPTPEPFVDVSPSPDVLMDASPSPDASPDQFEDGSLRVPWTWRFGL